MSPLSRGNAVAALRPPPESVLPPPIENEAPTSAGFLAHRESEGRARVMQILRILEGFSALVTAVSLFGGSSLYRVTAGFLAVCAGLEVLAWRRRVAMETLAGLLLTAVMAAAMLGSAVNGVGGGSFLWLLATPMLGAYLVRRARSMAWLVGTSTVVAVVLWIGLDLGLFAPAPGKTNICSTQPIQTGSSQHRNTFSNSRN